MNRGEWCKIEDYTPGWNFEGSSFTVKTEKYNLDGVADTLHHISPLFERGLWWGTRDLAGRSQPDLRIRGFLCVCGWIQPRCTHTVSQTNKPVYLPGPQRLTPNRGEQRNSSNGVNLRLQSLLFYVSYQFSAWLIFFYSQYTSGNFCQSYIGCSWMAKGSKLGREVG